MSSNYYQPFKSIFKVNPTSLENMGPQGNNKKRTMEEIPRSLDTRPRKKQIVSSSLVTNHKPRSMPIVIPDSPKNQHIINLCGDGPPMEHSAPVRPDIIGKKLVRPLATFPRFPDGQVYIELGYLNRLHTYQLHRGNLFWNSPAGFRNEILKPWDDLDHEVARLMTARTGISARFELFMDPELDLEILRRTNLTIFKNEAKSHEVEKYPVPVAISVRVEPVGSHKVVMWKSSSKFSTAHSQFASPGLSQDKIADSPARNAASPIIKNKCSKTCTEADIQVESELYRKIGMGGQHISADVKTGSTTPISNTLQLMGEAIDSHINAEGCEATIPKPKDVAATIKTENGEFKSEVQETQAIHADHDAEHKVAGVDQAKEDILHVVATNDVCQTTMPIMKNATTDIKTDAMRLSQAAPEVMASQAALQVNLAKKGIYLLTEIDDNTDNIVSIVKDVLSDNKPENINLKDISEVRDIQADVETGRAETQIDPLTGDILQLAKIEANGSTLAPNKEELIGVHRQVETDFKEINANAKTIDTKDFHTEDQGGLKVNIEPRKQGYSADEQAGKVPIVKPKQDILDAYHNLFSIYYTNAPIISPTDINNALEQIELLIRVAEACYSLAVVLPFIESAIFKFSRELPKAILSDAPRWLLLSVKIKSAHIYQAAMVHIAGCYPIWPSSILTEDHLPTRLIQFIERAQIKTALLRFEIDKKLFCNTIMSNNGSFVPTIEDEAGMNDTWFVVQMWRDWFSKAMANASKVKKPYNENEDGTLYRLLAQGRDAYLQFDSVMAKLVAFRTNEEKLDKVDETEVRKVLTVLKEQAQEIVAPLCVNNSLLSVEEAGIKYLTCHDVTNNDLPWVLLPNEFA